MSKHTLVLESLKLLPKQINHVLEIAKTLDLPKSYKNVDKIVVSGMGGSNLGGRIIQSVFSDTLKMPIMINATYEIPKHVDKNTLYVASSYSGGTEETLSAYNEAKKKKAKIIVVTSENKNNKLAKLAKKDKYPALIFKPEHNPSDQPRYALGYAVFALIAALRQAGVLKIKQKDIRTMLTKLNTWGNKLTPNKSANSASKIAHDLFTKNIVLVTGEFLEGNAHSLRNQFNENSKNFTCYLTLPELNHYAMEGLAKPKDNNLIFLFFESALYSPKVQKRLKLTKTVVTKNKIKTITHKLKGETKLEQSLEILQLGSWITFYLSELNKVDPIAIPWVDWFKKQLK